MPSLVSVIIPFKNAAPWLADAIDSSLAQTWRDVEVVLVDNGSTDASVELARRYESPRVALLACERAGASAARNVGLEKARGAFIQFLDADDVLDRDKIRIQMERLAQGPALALASGAWARFRKNPDEAVFRREPVWRDLAPSEFLISSWLGGGMMPSFMWLTPRATIDKAGPWNEQLSLNDDGEFFCRVALASSQILFCEDARGYYRSGAAATLSRRRDDDALGSAYRAIDLSCQGLLRQCDSPAALRACATHYRRFLLDAYPDVPDLVAAAEARVAQLGGSDLTVAGGPMFRLIRDCLGWKAAKRVQRQWHRTRTR